MVVENCSIELLSERRDFREETQEFVAENRHYCTCLSTKKSNNTKTHTRMRLISNFSFMTLIIVALLVRPPGIGLANARRLSDYELCKRGEYFEDYALKGGSKAGKYIKLGSVDTFEDCVDLCCQDFDCKMALMLKHSCFRVDCRKGDPHRCERISARRSKYNPKLFIRGEIERPMKIAKSGAGLEHFVSNSSLINDTALPELIRVKRRKASCRRYHGKVCKGLLDSARLYYFTTHSPSQYDRSLAEPFRTAKAELSPECKRYALFAICATWYPECSDPKHPKPTRLCRKSCEQLQDEYCQKEYDSDMSNVRSVLPVCDSLPDDDEDPFCVRLDDLTAEMPAESASESDGATLPGSFEEPRDRKRGKKPLDDADGSFDDSNSSKNTSLTTKAPQLTTISLPKKSLEEAEEGKREDIGSKKLEPTDEPRNTAGLAKTSNSLETTTKPKVTQTAQAVLQPSRSDSLKKSLLALDGGSSTALPTVQSSLVTVPVENTGETNLSEEDKKQVPKPTAATKIPKTSSITTIQVSAGENKVLILPEDHVSLYASTWPKQPKDVIYKYQWYKLAAPEKSHGYMEGKDKSRLILTKLDVPGVYQFKVTISTADGQSQGSGFVNVTVKSAPRVNHAPRAVIQPKDVTVQLPTNEAVLDGSKSTDDDKIMAYKWEEIKAPINGHGKIVSNGAHKPILELKNLEAGAYTFRLTVTDSDGEEDHDDVTIKVLPEKDYPPVARAGKDIVLQLPHNSAILYGNGSTDDKPGLKYEWTKTPDSPAVGDMLGTTTPILTVSNLDVGDYTFVLKVTDTSGQTSTSKVTVIVRPSKNEAPKAVAGSDKDLMFPDDSTILDARKSKDDGKIVKFQWEKVSGPEGLEMKDEDKPVLHVSKLLEGRYVFKLTITDDKGLSDSDTVAVSVKKNKNSPPVANAGPDVVLNLPTRAAELDGSKSSDDQEIVSYEWTRDRKSPAAGDVLNHSDHKAVLQLANLVEGVYTFELKVEDNRGLHSSDKVLLTVKQDENSLFLVELYLDVDIFSFTEENKRQLLRKLSVLLNVDDKNVVLEQIRQAGYGNGIVLLFYVIDAISLNKMDGLVVAKLLKQKVGYHGTLFEYKMLRVEPYICRNNCSNHGYCDKNSKLCVCDSFWMENFFKANYGERVSNCDWSVLYLSVVVFGIAMSLIGLTWGLCFCFSRRSRLRRKGRYYPLKTEDKDESKEEIMMIAKGNGKYFAHSLTFTESDEDSEEENTLFDKKRLSNGNGPLNGNANGSVKLYKTHTM